MKTGDRSIKDVYRGLGAGTLSTIDLTALDPEDRELFEVSETGGTEVMSIVTTTDKRKYGLAFISMVVVLILISMMK